MGQPCTTLRRKYKLYDDAYIIGDFDQEIRRSKGSVVLDISRKNKPLIIAFGGIAGQLMLPPYEFFNITKDIHVNKIFLRDLKQLWYHAGLPGLTDSVVSTANYLKDRIAESEAGKVVVFGTSMGGYAALLFGILIGADEVHAFAPNTFLDDSRSLRSKKQSNNLHQTYGSHYFDIRTIARKHNRSTRLHLYFDVLDRKDRKHALHMLRVKYTKYHMFFRGGHCLIRKMKEKGLLRSIIMDALSKD